jgi:hypothetical protein
VPPAEYPKTQKEKVNAYLFVMEEVRARLEVINAVLATPIVHYSLIVEICYLQFRHIAELVAIGCLLAYGDFKAYRAFEKACSPVEVFKHFENIWPHFFPQAFTRTLENEVHKINANSKPNAMTREEMEKLWATSGDKLHRLSVSKFFKRKRQETVEDALKEVRRITAKIIDLLDSHLIPLPSPKRMLLVTLSQTDCRVRAALMGFGDSNSVAVEEFTLR